MSDHHTRDHEAAWSGLCPSGQHGLDYRGQVCDLCPSTFTVWRKDGSDVDARTFHALRAQQAAELCAREDWIADATSWPSSYSVHDGVTGTIWVVEVTIAMEPTFVALDTREVEMSPTTHVMWGGHVLCEDLRLRHVPRDWPAQRWISLKDVADGAARPDDGCAACWNKAPGRVKDLLQIGKSA